MPSPFSLPLGPTVLVLALACTPATPPPTPSTAPPPAARARPHHPLHHRPRLDLQATAIDSSWGSSGVVAVDAPPPYWVIAVVELQAQRDATGLVLTDLELFDASARSLGHADRELELRLTSADATAFTGTDTTFDGTLTAGRSLRLKIRARMEDAFAARVATPPATYLATLHTDTGAILRITGTVGTQWPTA